MNQQDLTNQLVANTTNCISPYVTGCWPYTYTAPPSGALNVEKLPGGFIVTLNGRREIVASVEALTAYLERWGAAK